MFLKCSSNIFYLFIVSLGFMKGKLLDNCEFLLSPLTPSCLAKKLVIFSSAINSFPDSYIFTVFCFSWIANILVEFTASSVNVCYTYLMKVHTSNYILVLWLSTDQAVNLPCGRELMSRNKIIWIKSFQVQELFHSRTKLGSLVYQLYSYKKSLPFSNKMDS